MFKIAILLLFIFCGFSEENSYETGQCPDVTPLANFDMNTFLGMWYVVRKTKTANNCIVYNYSKLKEPHTYKIEQISRALVLGNSYHFSGQLTTPNVAEPANMTVDFPYAFGSASYIIFLTDYDNYAAIFTCKEILFQNKQSVSILSRTKTLDDKYLQKIYDKMRAFNVNPYDLSIISHDDCEETLINVDVDLFTWRGVKGVVKKAGEKVGDGVGYVASGAKNLVKGILSPFFRDDKKPKPGDAYTNDNAVNTEYSTPSPRIDVRTNILSEPEDDWMP